MPSELLQQIPDATYQQRARSPGDKVACRVDIPRITAPEQLNPTQRAAWDEITASRGAVAGPFSVLLHSPELARRFAHLGAYLRSESQLAAGVRYVACLTVARCLECQYAWAANVGGAEEAGMSKQSIAAIEAGRPLDEAGERESLVHALTTQLLRNNRVDGTLATRAHELLTDAELVELVSFIGYYGMVATVLNAFETDPSHDLNARPIVP